MEDVDGVAFTQRCLVRFNQAGSFLLNSVCTVDTGETVFPRGGPIDVSPGCGVVGQYREVFPPPDPLELVCRIQGAMAPDKNTISGVGNCGPLDIFTFNMVKR